MPLPFCLRLFVIGFLQLCYKLNWYGDFEVLFLLCVPQALASPTQRRDLLQQLFADVALQVDDRARGNQ